mmetsp:Transcript_12607/g.20365  ORF Transcript_12607/g.20365 Transcript_12607/m.20365 type:complete len:142 (-) Transcript_12607:924-1349(-)
MFCVNFRFLLCLASMPSSRKDRSLSVQPEPKSNHVKEMFGVHPISEYQQNISKNFVLFHDSSTPRINVSMSLPWRASILFDKKKLRVIYKFDWPPRFANKMKTKQIEETPQLQFTYHFRKELAQFSYMQFSPRNQFDNAIK